MKNLREKRHILHSIFQVMLVVFYIHDCVLAVEELLGPRRNFYQLCSDNYCALFFTITTTSIMNII